jgi:hypothetical protein
MTVSMYMPICPYPCVHIHVFMSKKTCKCPCFHVNVAMSMCPCPRVHVHETMKALKIQIFKCSTVCTAQGINNPHHCLKKMFFKFECGVKKPTPKISAYCTFKWLKFSYFEQCCEYCFVTVHHNATGFVLT